MREIRPQSGPQTKFLSSSADICVYGGAAGGGKTWGLLLEPLRHISNPGFSCVIFRRTYPQVTNPGGMWDESTKLYPLLGGQPRQSDLLWRFPSGAIVRFAHLQHEQNKFDWQGSQVPLICFDELTHFTQSQFLYMLSRNRSMSGVRPYVRATTNPDADSWVKDFLGPWVDDEHPAYPWPMGDLRWFTQIDGKIVWVDADWRDDNGLPGKSLTFVAASIFDNKLLLKHNPEYLANLRALPHVDQMRLLHGDWKVRPAAGSVFNRAWFDVVDAAPAEGNVVRYWDFAATEKKRGSSDPDWTVGVRMRRHQDVYYIEDVVRERVGPGEVDGLVYNIAHQDGTDVRIGWEEEGGSAGKRVSHHMGQMLDGFRFEAMRVSGDKVTRAAPFAAQAKAGNVRLVRGHWNSDFLTELHGFPDLTHDDQVDGGSGAYEMLSDFGRKKKARVR